MILVEKQITSKLTEKQYGDTDGCYATPDMGRNEIQPNIIYKDGDQVKFLLLPKAIDGGAYHSAEQTLIAAYRSGGMNTGSRAANGQRYGKKLTIGWYPQVPGHAIGSW